MASISLPKQTEEKIKTRAGERQTFSGQIHDDLSLCWALLDRGRMAIRDIFTHPEIMLLLDVQNSTFWDATQLPMWIRGGLTHQVSDGIALDGLDKKWATNGPALLAKIAALSDLETVALLDFCRDMWRHSDTPGHWDTELARFAQ